MNKIRFIYGIITFIVGLVLSVGLQTVFEVCPVTEKIMKCHWSGRALIGIGVILIIASILIILFKKPGEQKILIINVLALDVVGILIPKVLIGGCSDSMMTCQSLSYPVVYLVSGISIVISVIYFIYLLKVNKNE